MKNLIATLLVFISFNSFAQQNFNGDWFYEDSTAVLRINLEADEIYLYDESTGDIFPETIYKIQNNEFGYTVVYTSVLFVGHKFLNEYYVMNNDLYYYSVENKETLIYKKK